MKKTTLYSILLLSIVILSVIGVSVYKFDGQKHFEDIRSLLKEQYEIDVSGDVSATVFPWPEIIIDNLVLKTKKRTIVQTDKIKLGVSILSGDIKVVKLSSAKLLLASSTRSIISNLSLDKLPEITADRISIFTSARDRFNVRQLLYDHGEYSLQLVHNNLETSSTGSIEQEEENIYFDSNISNALFDLDIKGKFHLQSKQLAGELDISFPEYNAESNIESGIKANINKINDRIELVDVTTYGQPESLPINISKVDHFRISFVNKLNGSASIHAKSLDLDYFVSVSPELKNMFQYHDKIFLDLALNLKSDEVIYNKEKYYKMEMNLLASKQIIFLPHLKFLTKNQELFRLEATTTNNDYIQGTSRFSSGINRKINSIKGKLLFRGKEIKSIVSKLNIRLLNDIKIEPGEMLLNMDFDIKPYNAYLSNIRLQSKGIVVNGELHFKYGFYKPIITGDVYINKLQYKKMISKNEVDELIRDIKFDTDIKIHISNFQYNDFLLDKFSFLLIQQGDSLILKNFLINSKKISVGGELIILNDSIVPKFSLSLNAEKFDFKILQMQDKLKGFLDFDLLFLGKYNGGLDFKFDNLIYNDSVFQDIDIQAKLADGKMIFSKIEMSFADGRIKIKNAKINFSNNIITWTMSPYFDNVSIGKLLETVLLVNNNDVISGRISIGGSVGGLGRKISDLFTQNRGLFIFNARPVTIKGINLHKLQYILVKAKDAKEAMDYIQQHISSGKTVFDYAKGKISLDKNVLKLGSKKQPSYVSNKYHLGTFDTTIDYKRNKIGLNGVLRFSLPTRNEAGYKTTISYRAFDSSLDDVSLSYSIRHLKNVVTKYYLQQSENWY